MLYKEKLLDDLKTRMKYRITKAYDDDFLLGEIDSSISKVAKARFVKKDELTEKFSEDIVNIALYNIALIGGDFQTFHREGSTNRGFVTEKEVLSQIIPTFRVY